MFQDAQIAISSVAAVISGHKCFSFPFRALLVGPSSLSTTWLLSDTTSSHSVPQASPGSSEFHTELWALASPQQTVGTGWLLNNCFGLTFTFGGSW